MVHYVCGVCFCSGGSNIENLAFISGDFNKWKSEIQQQIENSCFDHHAKSVHHREADVRFMGLLNNRR